MSKPGLPFGVLLRRHQDPLPLLPQRSGAGYGTCRLSPGEPAAFAPCQPAAGTGRASVHGSTAGAASPAPAAFWNWTIRLCFTAGAHKLFNALVRGEPYQFAHQTLEYTVRVEPITDGVPSEVTDFCLYGNCLGRIQIGDEVRIRAKEQGGQAGW